LISSLSAALLVLTAFSCVSFAAGSVADASGTLSSDTGSISVSAGAKYLMPQHYKGSDIITSAGGAKLADTNISRPDGFLAPSVSITAERQTSLALPGLRDIRLVGEFSYSGGSARSNGLVTTQATEYIILLSVDPAYNWIGGIGAMGTDATSRVSISQGNFDLRLGLEGKGTPWQPGGGEITATPVFGAGIYASTQRYKVSTEFAELSGTDIYKMAESIRTTDIGPELRAGISFALPGGARAEALASAALLVGWADLDASQALQTGGGWLLTKRSPTYSATRSVSDVLVSGLFGLTLRGEVPVAEKCTLGLEASGRIWTSRPTIDNPLSIGGTGVVTTGTNDGVRIGQDSASELGAALRLSYSF
jgi:hypothetical protein